MFNLRAVNNYFEQKSYDAIFGCRFNVVKDEFEMLLASLRSAGAELIFVSKKSLPSLQKDDMLDQFKRRYDKGLELIEIMKNKRLVKEVILNDSTTES